MQIGSEMAALQEKTQKWTLKHVFSEKSPRIFSFWKKFLKTYIKPAILLKPIYRDIEFILRGLPERCGLYYWKVIVLVKIYEQKIVF